MLTCVCWVAEKVKCLNRIWLIAEDDDAFKERAQHRQGVPFHHQLGRVFAESDDRDLHVSFLLF